MIETKVITYQSESAMKAGIQQMEAEGWKVTNVQQQKEHGASSCLIIILALTIVGLLLLPLLLFSSKTTVTVTFQREQYFMTVQDAIAAVKANPKNPDVWVALGDAMATAGDVDKARKSYVEALALVPDHSKALEGLARLSIATPPTSPEPQRAARDSSVNLSSAQPASQRRNRTDDKPMTMSRREASNTRPTTQNPNTSNRVLATSEGTTKNPNIAMLIEVVFGIFGFLGIGYIYAGWRRDGFQRLIGWWVINFLVGMFIERAIGPYSALFDISMLLWWLGQFGVPIISGRQLKARFSLNETTKISSNDKKTKESRMKTIRRVGVGSVARAASNFSALLFAVFGLPLFLLPSVLWLGLLRTLIGWEEASRIGENAMLVALIFYIMGIAIYGVLGGIVGGLYAIFYNISARSSGGIEIEIS